MLTAHSQPSTSLASRPVCTSLTCIEMLLGWSLCQTTSVFAMSDVKLIEANLVKAYKYTTTDFFLVLVYCVILFSVLCQKTSVAKRPFIMHEPLLGGIRTTFQTFFFYRCTMHSDIHTVHSPTDAHLLKL